MPDLQLGAYRFHAVMEEASSINLKRSIVYGVRTINTLLQYVLQGLHFVKFRIFDLNVN